MRHEIEQNTGEWMKLREGRFTGSPAKLFFVKGKNKDEIGAGLSTYITELVVERLTYPSDNEWVDPRQWGHDHEDEAHELYEDTVGFTRVISGGFFTNGEFTGCSPDGEIGNGKGITEVKCPANSINHYLTFISGEVPKEHIPQCVWNMRETGAEYCDFISYDPRFIKESHKIFIKRIFLKDFPKENELLDKKLPVAINMVVEKLKQAEEY